MLQDSPGEVTVRKEEPTRAAARTLEGQQKEAVPTKCIAGSISKKKKKRTKINKSMKKTLQLLPHKIDRIKKDYTNKLDYLEETVNL